MRSGVVDPSARVRAALRERLGPGERVRVARAPGRVNLIGDHTDYNEGFVLPMSLGRAVWVAARARPDPTVRLVSLNFETQVDYRLGTPPDPGSSWDRYVAGVADLLYRRELVTTGFDAAIWGDVPIGSGLSSSAALEMATLLALQAVFEFELDAVAAARCGQEVEHRYVRVECGIMDQFASRLARAGHALHLDCRSLQYEHVPLRLGSAVPVVVDSRAPRVLAASAYNERRRECEQGVAFFHRMHPQVRALRDVTPEMLDRCGGGLAERVLDRCRHVVEENARVDCAVSALRAGDASRIGRLMTASHESLRDLFEVSSPRLDRLVEIASSVDGVLGSRLTGAGFGGCTIHLVERDALGRFSARLAESCSNEFGVVPAVEPVEQMLEAGIVP